MDELRFRQIHLDFHTSEYIPDIAADFQPEQFADTLKNAFVDSVTCFARCHHGWLYYPSKTHPELVHPNLKNKNLLLEQIEACHKRNIRVPVYTTVRWDARVMREHPEWLCLDENNNFIDMQEIPEPHFYRAICLNSGYRGFFKEHLLDIIDVVGADRLDGIFMDIVVQVECNCEHCRQKMRELHMDPDQKEERIRYAALMLIEFEQEISEFILSHAPGISIFYNDSRLDPESKRAFDAYSHLELESLPSGSWGYDHFPATVRYARTLGKEIIGMTGKFHTYWGDFHSLKNHAALEFECYRMLAMGAGCSIGDQLHPSGRLSDGTYQLIGHIYGTVARKEKYCRGPVPETQIAVLTPVEYMKLNPGDSGLPGELIGVVRMLQELACQFDIVDSDADLDRYELVVLPDRIPYSRRLEQKLKEYLEDGGCLLGTYQACLPEQIKSALFGVRTVGDSSFTREFVMPNETIGRGLPKEEYVMYGQGYDIETEGAQILMEKVAPYFERGGNRFCSHQHAPSSGKRNGAEVTKKGNAVYCAHPLFSLYRKNAAVWCKTMVRDMLDILLPDRRIIHNGPSTLLCTLNINPKENREILHLLHYIPENRSEDIATIEDVIPVYDIQIRLSTKNREVLSVNLLPEEENIAFEKDGNHICFTVKKISGHQILGIQYAEARNESRLL